MEHTLIVKMLYQNLESVSISIQQLLGYILRCNVIQNEWTVKFDETDATVLGVAIWTIRALTV